MVSTEKEMRCTKFLYIKIKAEYKDKNGTHVKNDQFLDHLKKWEGARMW